MKEDDFAGSIGYVMDIDRTLKEAPIAEIKVDTPYSTGVTQAICFRGPLCDPVIGNFSGPRNPDDPVSNVETCAAAFTRAEALKNATIKPLVAKGVTAQIFITKDKLSKLQQKDIAMEKYVDLGDAVK